MTPTTRTGIPEDMIFTFEEKCLGFSEIVHVPLAEVVGISGSLVCCRRADGFSYSRESSEPSSVLLRRWTNLLETCGLPERLVRVIDPEREDG